ncbi:MAG TPA: murein biosynthesis integral membrane protein MurJ, partial [Dehalococcoidia bacterium]|nr:murein biosynthesis integral membrane protein MurJ [Dehalococcoidia bacterium]
ETGRQEELQGLAVDLTRLMLISPVLFAVSGMVTGILNARHRFLLPALAPMLYNLAIIGGALLLAEPLGIRGLAVGVVAGAGLHLLVQVPGLVRAGLLYRPTVHWRDRGLREVAGLMLPRILGLAAAQFNFIVALFFASREGDEVIAALNYAWLIATLPLALFGMAIATAVFPTLAEQAAGDEMGKLRSTLAGSLRFALFLTIPASAGLILLRWPVVTFLLEHGAFTQTSTEITGNALLFYALGLWAHGATEVLSRGFYALRDTRTPVALAVLAMLLNWLFIVVLVGPLGYRGIALAMSLAASVEAGLLLLLLRRRLRGLREGPQARAGGLSTEGPEAQAGWASEERSLAFSISSTLLATSLMALAVLLLIRDWGPLHLGSGEGTLWALATALAGALLGGAVFLVAALAVGSPEAAALRRRLRWRR